MRGRHKQEDSRVLVVSLPVCSFQSSLILTEMFISTQTAWNWCSFSGYWRGCLLFIYLLGPEAGAAASCSSACSLPSSYPFPALSPLVCWERQLCLSHWFTYSIKKNHACVGISPFWVKKE